MKKSDFIILREEREIKRKLLKISQKHGFDSISAFTRALYRMAIEQDEKKKLVLCTE